MRYQITVKGGSEAQNKAWSKKLSAAVTQLEAQVARRNAVVSSIKNRMVIREAIQEAMARRMGGN